jgi:hypothetical protein
MVKHFVAFRFGSERLALHAQSMREAQSRTSFTGFAAAVSVHIREIVTATLSFASATSTKNMARRTGALHGHLENKRSHHCLKKRDVAS